jgi:hypothetical protein
VTRDQSPDRRGPLVAAIVATALLAFAAYRATLLPGLDFGDTAAFQDAGGQIEVTPRQGYPLYFALGNLVVWSVDAEPAFAMNLASALWGALACGLITALAAQLTRSVPAGLFSGTLYASSYTFWSQSIIAEVYALHIALLTLSLLALVWWSQRPASLSRLALFFAVYALGFGNHLMMVLLLPAATVFLAVHMPGGLLGLVRLRVLGLALVLATLGALQYVWNLHYLWSVPVEPPRLADALSILWFDVTKTDWRSTMVAGIDRSAYRVRLGMYWFDLVQQFGWAGVALACMGVAWFLRQNWRVFLLVFLGYVVAVGFAYTYNVGDTHVFFLPSHLFVAVAAGGGVAAVLHLSPHVARGALWRPLIALALLYPAWRFYDTYPAVDRSADRRPVELIDGLTSGLDSTRSVLLADLNWQLQNGLDYYNRHLHPDLAQMRGSDRALTLPWLIHDNLASGREVVLTPVTRDLLATAYGSLFEIEPDPLTAPAPLAARLAALSKGTPYVLAVLRAYRDVPLDVAELADAVTLLTAGTATVPPDGVYTIMVGRVGERPILVRREQRPFRFAVRVGTVDLDVRMESWLPADTIRRAGFGHVIAGRRHALTLERGVSVVAFGPTGRPLLTTYASGLFAPVPRFRIRPRPAA